MKRRGIIFSKPGLAADSPYRETVPTFVPCAVPRTKHDEICAIGHRSVKQVVPFYLQPVPLARLVLALQTIASFIDRSSGDGQLRLRQSTGRRARPTVITYVHVLEDQPLEPQLQHLRDHLRQVSRILKSSLH